MPRRNTCRVRLVAASDESAICVRIGGLDLPGGQTAEMRDDAEVHVHPRSGNGCVAQNNTDPSNNVAPALFSELIGEGAIAPMEGLATRAYSAGPQIAFGVMMFGLLHKLMKQTGRLTARLCVCCKSRRSFVAISIRKLASMGR